MANLVHLGSFTDGTAIYDRPDGSHLHEGVRELLPEIFADMDPEKTFQVVEHDFGKVIGETSCVETSDEDVIVFAQRPNRSGLSRFVKSRATEATTVATAIVCKDEGNYYLVTAFVGDAGAKEPWDSRASDADRAYWQNHALVWGSQEVIPGTETSDCPW